MAVIGSTRRAHSSTVALLAAGISAAAIGLAALLGWILSTPLLASWRPDTVPMAPTTAVLSLLLGATLGLCAPRSPSGTVVRMASITGWAGFAGALALLLMRLWGTYWPAEHLGFRIAGTIRGLPVGFISPVTALAFLFGNAAILTCLYQDQAGSWRRWLTWSTGGLLSAIGFALVLAHTFGAPLLLRPGFIPPALNTSVVLLTGGLALLVLADSLGIEPRGAPDAAPRGSRVLALIFAAFAVSTIAGGYGYYTQEERELRQEAQKQLEVIAKLKGAGVSQWRTERLGDATVMLHSTFLSGAFERFLQTPGDSATIARIRDWLGSFQAHRQYDRAFLMDAQGATRLSLTAEPPSAAIVRQAADVLRTGQVSLLDFYMDERDQRVHLAILAPIIGASGDRRPIGVLALRIDPRSFLYPYIQGWPTTSTTAEALLVRRDGADVVFLSDLRFAPNAALRRRVSLEDTRVLAVQAVRGQTGAAEGVDYRGAPVLGALYPIPDSPWYLIARLDVAEFRTQLRARVWLVAAFTTVLLVGGGSTLGLVRRSQGRRFFRKQGELTAALRASEERLRLALVAADQGLYDLDVQTGEALVSPEYATMLGFDPAEFHETNDAWIERMHPDDRTPVVAAYQSYIAGLHDEYRVEFRQRTKNGDWKWILSLGKLISREPGKPLRMLGTHTDITARKIAEIKSQRFAQLYGALSQCNQAIVRSVDEAALFPQICRDTVVFGGMGMAWIGLVDDVSQKIQPAASYGGAVGCHACAGNFVDAEDPLGGGPAGTAIRENRPVWWQHCLQHPPTASHDRAERCEWASAAALPLRRQGRAIGVLTLYSSAVDAFDEDIRSLLVEIATDISFALDNFARERARREADEALRESLARFQLANRATFNVIWDWNLQTGILWWNDNFCTAFGYRPEDIQPNIDSWITRIHPDDRDRVEAGLRDVVASQRDTWSDEYRLRRSDGAYAAVVDRGYVSRDAHGRALRMIGAIEDITARKQVEAMLAEQLDELRRWYNATLGRENRVLEMKKEVNELLARAGQPPRYPSAWKRQDPAGTSSTPSPAGQ